jgi:hypothetical protein
MRWTPEQVSHPRVDDLIAATTPILGLFAVSMT